MCTYDTSTISVTASGKTTQGWRSLNAATVYFDHPIHLPAGHALMIDVRRHDGDAAERIALELDAASARQLAETILTTLASVPSTLL
jgi:Family of unknown function (DUF6295)